MIPKKLQAQVDELAKEKLSPIYATDGAKQIGQLAEIVFQEGAQAMAKLILESEELKGLVLQCEYAIRDFHQGTCMASMGCHCNMNSATKTLTNWQAFIDEVD